MIAFSVVAVLGLIGLLASASVPRRWTAFSGQVPAAVFVGNLTRGQVACQGPIDPPSAFSEMEFWVWPVPTPGPGLYLIAKNARTGAILANVARSGRLFSAEPADRISESNGSPGTIQRGPAGRTEDRGLHVQLWLELGPADGLGAEWSVGNSQARHWRRTLRSAGDEVSHHAIAATPISNPDSVFTGGVISPWLGRRLDVLGAGRRAARRLRPCRVCCQSRERGRSGRFGSVAAGKLPGFLNFLDGSIPARCMTRRKATQSVLAP